MIRLSVLTFLAVLVLNAGTAFAAAGETIHVRVLGLVCDFCAQAIEKTFMRTDKVESVDVDLDSALITIVMKEGITFTDEDITAKVTDAGYTIESIHHGTEAGDE